MSNELVNNNSNSLKVFSREIVELTCPPTTIEHPTDLNIGIPHEFNSLPMSCYDKHIKDNQEHIYYLNPQKTRYVKISPGFNNKINGEFEERILFAILLIAYYQKDMLGRGQISNTIVTTIAEILKVLGLKYDGNYKKRITKSLERLCGTSYVFKDCYYNAGEQTWTSKNMSIIHSFEYISHLDVNKLDPEIAGLFTDKRVKDLLVIKLDDSVIDNFINKKGYLLYNANKLLSINTGIARKLFMYCDRNRWGNENDLIFSEKINVLTQVIPIMTTDFTRVSQIIQNSLKELKNKNLIVDYIFNKGAPLKNSWIEVVFEKSRKYDKEYNSQPIIQKNNDQLFVHSREIIDVTPKKETNSKIEVDDNLYILDVSISDLFKGFVLQNSTIKLINQLYSTHGIMHVKALTKDTMERADNYDSYIFKMLSSNAEPKWYALNQAKFMHELNTQDELLEIKQQVKSQYDSLVDEYNQYCSNADNLQELTQKLQGMIDDRIAYFTNNPQKLVVQVIGLDKYLINMTNRFQKYLTDDYLFFAWLKFNQKHTDTIQNNKLYIDFYSEFNIYL